MNAPKRFRPARPRPLVVGALTVALTAVAACQGPGSLTEGHGPLAAPKRVGTIQAAPVNESSGIVASRKTPGMFWTMNDSGGGARVYAIDAKGKLLRSAVVAGARNVDWEDIAADEAGRLYVADVGDNARTRTELAIYAFDEPGPDDRQVKVEAVTRFKYPPGHGPTDCEAMFVHKGWAYLINKDLLFARLYRVRLAGAKDKDLVTAEYLRTLPGAAWITAADITPDGRHLAALSYTAIYIYDLPKAIDELTAGKAKDAAGDEEPATQAATTAPAKVVSVKPRRRLANLRQAEAICWILDNPPTRLLITNEQREMYEVHPAGAE